MAAKTKKKGKVPKPPTKVDAGKTREEVFLEECQDHEDASYKDLSIIRSDWPDKESILLCRAEDKISKKSKNEVFDPILPEMSLERASRVMAQNATGRAWAVSKNDVGKNIMMNHLHRYWKENANEKWSHLIKQRLMNFYSGVYGSFFGLVPWWVNLRSGYIGPELLPIPMRNIRPQPGKVSPDESDWFGVKDRVSLQWLLEQDPEVWNMAGIEALEKEIRADEGKGDSTPSTHDDISYVEQESHPTRMGDKAFPPIDIFTEYRVDIWITWTPRRVNKKTSKPHILRIVENNYPEGMLPIVVKHSFPLIDRMIGLGDFEKGKTLQFSINALWNLYLTGVKYSIFPPLHIDPNSVVASSIKWGAGERWFMDRPNVDVQAMKMSPSGMRTFTSTYNYMQSAIFNLYGSTQISQPAGQTGDLGGKSPEAIKRRAFKEGARDEWDRFMQEECIKAVYKRWTALGVNNLDHTQAVRIFGAEIQDLQAAFPDEDILEVFESKKRGNVFITKDRFLDVNEEGNVAPVKFDYELDSGSSLKANPEGEAEFLQALMDTLLSKPELLPMIETKGKTIDFAEMTKRIIMGPVKDWDRILIDIPKTEGAEGEEEVLGPDGKPVITPGAEVTPTGEVPVEGKVPATETPQRIEIRDPEIAEAISGAFRGTQVPPTPVA